MASVSRALGEKLRRIDDIPTRIELIQYERRFVELVDESALKLDETRKFYSMYNTLEDTLKFLHNQVALIDSIYSNFEDAQIDRAKASAYLTQMRAINTNMRQLTEKYGRTLTQRRSEMETLECKHQLLLDNQRQYFAAIKEFQDLCEANQKLRKD